MSSKVLYPSLTDSWVSSSLGVADNLMCCFILSDYSQSYLYQGFVSSLPWIIQDTQGDMSRTCSVTQSTLSDYFSRFFNNVAVEVTEIPNTASPSKAQISIYLSFQDSENKTFVLGRLLNIVNSKIAEVIITNNGV
jgi:hypothetical protein